VESTGRSFKKEVSKHKRNEPAPGGRLCSSTEVEKTSEAGFCTGK
jgi:hypothetical protein